jgi:hypothetical protein
MQYVSDSFATALENMVLPVPAELWSNNPLGHQFLANQKVMWYFRRSSIISLTFVLASLSSSNLHITVGMF